MAKRKGPKPVYPGIKKRLISRGLRTQSRNLKRLVENRRGPSIPQMYPGIKKPSNYRRSGKSVVTKTKPRMEKAIKYDAWEDFTAGKARVVEVVSKDFNPQLNIHFNIRRLSRRSFARGGGGGAQLLGKGARKTGTAGARRTGHRLGGTRGGRPGSEPKKQGKA